MHQHQHLSDTYTQQDTYGTGENDNQAIHTSASLTFDNFADDLADTYTNVTTGFTSQTVYESGSQQSAYTLSGTSYSSYNDNTTGDLDDGLGLGGRDRSCGVNCYSIDRLRTLPQILLGCETSDRPSPAREAAPRACPLPGYRARGKKEKTEKWEKDFYDAGG